MESMNTETNKVFAYRFNQALTEHGWNLSDLARRVGVTPQAAQKWAKGISIPRGLKLKSLAEVTGKPEHWYFMQPDTDDPEVMAQLGIPKKLDVTEEALLAIFNQLPEAEKLRLIIHAKGVLKELEELKDDVGDLIKNLNR
ncbi:helix-turn-helix domain-containing protein [Salmonella enterica]|jgi:transcriptional regulator with XRE-family HTH domain|uniref:Transcriptional regulator n=3 Tax=Enterobacteriaceae TaxID=543 RepID=A0A5Z6ED72_SALSE|nr:transcriptional regulator [Salmonella enterica subsp. enterica serovar Newington]EAA6423196.1 transcriptional regulator [Salmonella enterica subsp. enterica serovar Senftenberg]EAM8694736.1 transcriptional regulator [Salmonella enterica]EAN0663029.1 transcriptional regulator [Salmonella enterica subsp. enterica serovar Orion]EAT2971897.1 transcriptional regulator [Salmonella enterica subsp. enterica serovar Worthington]EAW1356774.1 helix-turn-helix domain-containing protein [Salmonella ente